MCGIIGAVSYRETGNVLLEGLQKLEYRGYDSAGLAVLDESSKLQRLRVKGKVQALADAMALTPLRGCTGIAHTRWATHGKPEAENAHPHVSHNEVAIVHNGIIENHESLRSMLKARGYEFVSETDSEVAAHLIHSCFSGDLLAAVAAAAREMEGAFALGVIHSACPNEIIGARRGSPLVAGIGADEHFIASDTLALAPFATSAIYLEEGEMVRITSGGIEIFTAEQVEVKREPQPIPEENNTVDKGGWQHFMLKEIFEQTDVVRNMVANRTISREELLSSFDAKMLELFADVQNIHIIACGTSYHAGLVAKYWLEALVKVPVQVEVASEYRYREIVVPVDALFISVSQSGETADTLAALEKARGLNYLATLTICNVDNSTLVRESSYAFMTEAGTEIGVASTKAFTSQLVAFLLLSAAMCRDDRADEVLQELQRLPHYCAEILKMNENIAMLAARFVDKNHTLFLGRGAHFPVALEGALKLKEISYIHAEAYPAGELKHGPLALVDENMPVIAVAPDDELMEKLKSNLHEVSARGGELFVFAANTAAFDHGCNMHLIPVPAGGHWTLPVLYTIPLQLLAYHVALLRGTDVDQPRNLAKSVTVE